MVTRAFFWWKKESVKVNARSFWVKVCVITNDFRVQTSNFLYPRQKFLKFWILLLGSYCKLAKSSLEPCLGKKKSNFAGDWEAQILFLASLEDLFWEETFNSGVRNTLDLSQDLAIKAFLDCTINEQNQHTTNIVFPFKIFIKHKTPTKYILSLLHQLQSTS